MGMSMDLMRMSTVVKLVTPTEVVLSVFRGVLGCGHTISMRVWLRGTISLVAIYIPANSASAADDITNFIIFSDSKDWTIDFGNGVIFR